MTGDMVGRCRYTVHGVDVAKGVTTEVAISVDADGVRAVESIERVKAPDPEPDTQPWGIVIEWDEDGIECRQWARHALRSKRLDFSTPALAQQYIEALLAVPSDVDAIATPHRFGDTGPLMTPRPAEFAPRPAYECPKCCEIRGHGYWCRCEK